MENKIETKKHEPIVYKVYDYLKTHHYGHMNGIKRNELAEKFNINARILRKITSKINSSLELEKLVSTSHSCYMCETKEECENAIRNTYRTAITLLKKGKAKEKKVGLNGQIKIKLGKHYKDVVETFSAEE